MTQLLIATANKGKVAEFSSLLGDVVDVVSLRDVGVKSPEETGSTFTENATIKATHGARASGLITVADDSGIVVDALDGAPGVLSARFAGIDATDEENRSLLLRRLREVPSRSRSARFVCILAVAHPDGRLGTFEGMLEGTVAGEERGAGGFGYDPVFELEDGLTVAELAPEQKNRISHRAKALQNALPYIHSLLAAEA